MNRILLWHRSRIDNSTSGAQTVHRHNMVPLVCQGLEEVRSSMAVQMGVGEEERCPTLQPSDEWEIAILASSSASLGAHPAQQISQSLFIHLPFPRSPPIRPSYRHPPSSSGRWIGRLSRHTCWAEITSVPYCSSSKASSDAFFSLSTVGASFCSFLAAEST